MGSEEQFLENLPSALETGKHLSPPGLSVYINFYASLSAKEKGLVERHLETCADCRREFERVFDAELELDPSVVAARLSSLGPHTNGSVQRMLRSVDGKIAARLVGDSGNRWSLKIESLPPHLYGAKTKLVLSPVISVRIPSLQKNAPIVLPPNNDIQVVREITLFMAPADKERRMTFLLSPAVRYLAAAAAVIAFVAVIRYMTQKPDERLSEAGEPKITRDTVSAEKNKTEEKRVVPDKKEVPDPRTFADTGNEAYRPDDVLEAYIGKNFRSDKQVDVLSPKNADTLGSPIAFAWKISDEPRACTIVLADNNGGEIRRTETDKSEWTYVDKLKPGLYYWKILCDGELAAVRKFYIRK